jgi:hypothetical protein
MSKNVINLWKYAKELEKKAQELVNTSTIEILWEVIQKSPVDTWEFLKWNKRKLASKQWDTIVGLVYNDSKNAENVENWWGTREVSRSKFRKKWGPVIHIWQGSTTFLRSYIEKREKIIDDFNKNLKL